MKIYSDNAISKTDLDVIDAKQDRQIKQLRWQLVAVCVFNALLAVALRFL